MLAPQLQLGREPQVKLAPTDNLYPVARAGLAKQGAEVYRSLGCVYCHSQQVGQEGVKAEIVLTERGTNLVALQTALAKFPPIERVTSLPQTVGAVADMNAADPILKVISATGAKAMVQVSALGPDMSRGWGQRRTVAQDYAFDLPVQLGSRRCGPDLSNVGSRLPDANWHLRHLYAPQSEVKGSPMPPARFLFEKRKLKPGQKPSPDAIPLSAAGIFFDVSKDTGPVEFELVPTDDARALAAYLVSLRADAPLFEAPFTAPTPPPAATNSPAK